MICAYDICAGAGGLSLGLTRAGFSVCAVEKEAHECATHEANVPGAVVHGDVRDFYPPWPAVLVAGGVPCQSFSHAGDRGGLEDERGQLYLELLRIADEAHAEACVLENVRGLKTWRSEDGTALALIRRAFQRAGWHTVDAILNAADFGVPQFRQRLFIVGFRSADASARWRWPAPTHGPPGNLFGLPAWITVRQALGLRGGYETGRMPGIDYWQGGRYVDVDAPAPACGTRGNADLLKPLDRPAPTVTAADSGIQRNRARRSQRPLDSLAEAVHEHALLDAPAHTICAGYDTYCDGAAAAAAAAALHEAVHAAGLLDRPSTTVSADSRVWPAGNHDEGMERGGRNKGAVRLGAVRLGAAQLSALQGFPAEWRWLGKCLQRQIGNAVPPALAEAMGRAVLRALRPEEDTR